MSTELRWILQQLHWERPGYWLLVSFLAAAILHLLQPTFAPRRREQIRLLRWVLIPYLGLLAGGLSPRLMGLSQVDWVAGLGLGLGIVVAVLVLLALIRATFHWQEGDGEGAEETPALFGSWVTPWILAGALEFHWAFLRGAVWELLLALPQPPDVPAYWAVWIAALLALPGLVALRRQTARRLMDGLILLTTSILFFYTRNFWLCWLLHGGIQALLMRPQRRVSPA